jgi:hypothetical protein
MAIFLVNSQREFRDILHPAGNYKTIARSIDIYLSFYHGYTCSQEFYGAVYEQ